MRRSVSRAAAAGDNPKPENVVIVSPVMLPGRGRLIQSLNRIFFLPLVIRALRLRGVRAPVVWTYLPTRLALSAIRRLKPSVVLYDCVFDVSLHPGYPPDSVAAEKEIVGLADIVLTDNQHLFAKCRRSTDRVYLVPAGVDYHAFALPAGPPADKLTGIGRPRICFFGGIDDIRIDLDLIAHIAKIKPGWNILLIGPVIKTDVSKLRLKNIFFLGTVPFNILPSYVQGMDALILPYKIIPFSKSIFPAKLFECLASGLPVVATPLEEIRRLPEGLIVVARTHQEFVCAIEAAMSCDTEEKKLFRLQTAQANSWEARCATLEKIVQTYRKDL